MVAYLLCAGFGTRMGALTDETPKSLLPVGSRPILDYLLDELLQWQDLNAIHVAVNNRDHDAFRAWASERRPALASAGVDLRLHNDGVSHPDNQLGAVGDLQFLLNETGRPSSGSLVSGGDSLYRFPLAPVLNAFDGNTPQVLALHEPSEALRRKSSTLILDGSRVIDVSEMHSQTRSERICPSWYLLSPSALDEVGPYLRDGKDPDTLGTLIGTLASGQRIDAVLLPERRELRLHCNTPDDLEKARALLQSESRLVLDDGEVRRCLPE